MAGDSFTEASSHMALRFHYTSFHNIFYLNISNTMYLPTANHERPFYFQKFFTAPKLSTVVTLDHVHYSWAPKMV